MLYLDDEERQTQKWEHYAVRVIASICRIFSSHPEKIREEDMYVRYEEPEYDKTEVDKPSKTLEERTREAYAHVAAAFGVDFSSKLKKDK